VAQGKAGQEGKENKMAFSQAVFCTVSKLSVCSHWKEFTFVGCVSSFSTFCQEIDHYAETLFLHKNMTV
jgi:hypothetical protein